MAGRAAELAAIEAREVQYYEIWTKRPGNDERWYIHDFGYLREEYAQLSIGRGKKKFPGNEWAFAIANVTRSFQT